MGRFKSVLGRTFGDWTVIEETERGMNRRVKCRCTCGSEDMVLVSSLRRGKSTCCVSCSHFVSIFGREFGDWTVIEEKERGRNRRVKCRCKCGREEMVQVGALRGGKSNGCQSCANFESVLGREFGDWTVIEEIERCESNGVKRRAKCRCKCGWTAMVRVCDLRSGKSTCCKSCSQFESVLGRKFGKLTVAAEPERGDNRKVICDCDCGTKGFLVAFNHLQSGNTKSCGCMKHCELCETGFIYYLLDPISMKIRYVGQTVRDPQKRLYEHIYESKTNKQKLNWIWSLYPHKPQVIIIERNVPINKLTERENLHIKRCLRRNQPLLNICLPSEIAA